jgi:hypothetical protein
LYISERGSFGEEINFITPFTGASDENALFISHTIFSSNFLIPISFIASAMQIPELQKL